MLLRFAMLAVLSTAMRHTVLEDKVNNTYVRAVAKRHAGSYVIWEGVGMKIGSFHSQLLLCPVDQIKNIPKIPFYYGTVCDGKGYKECFSELKAGTDLGYQSKWQGTLFPDAVCTRIAYGGTGLSSIHSETDEYKINEWKKNCSGLTNHGAGRSQALPGETGSNGGHVSPAHFGKASTPPDRMLTGNIRKIYMGHTDIEASELQTQICGGRYAKGFTKSMYTDIAHNCNWAAKKILQCVLGLSAWWVPSTAVGDIAWCKYDTW